MSFGSAHAWLPLALEYRSIYLFMYWGVCLVYMYVFQPQIGSQVVLVLMPLVLVACSADC